MNMRNVTHALHNHISKELNLCLNIFRIESHIPVVASLVKSVVASLVTSVVTSVVASKC